MKRYYHRGMGDAAPAFSVLKLNPGVLQALTQGVQPAAQPRSGGMVQEAETWWSSQSTGMKVGVVGAGVLFVGAVAYMLIK